MKHLLCQRQYHQMVHLVKHMILGLSLPPFTHLPVSHHSVNALALATIQLMHLHLPHACNISLSLVNLVPELYITGAYHVVKP